MAKSVTCPKCRQPITRLEPGADGRVLCTNCGAKLKVKTPAAAAPRNEPLDDELRLAPVADAASQEPASPPAAAPRPRSASPKKAPKKKAKTSAFASLWKNEQTQLYAATGGVAVFVLLVAGGIWKLTSRSASDSDVSSSSPASIQGDFQGTEIRSAPVVLEKPFENVGPEFQGLATGVTLTAAEKFDVAKMVSAGQPVNTPAEPPAAPTQEWNDPARWEAPMDPPAPDSDYQIAADLRVGFSWSTFPLLADRNGPFVVTQPTRSKNPFVVTKKKDSNDRELTEVEQPPIPVIDLRTGQPAGQFDWRIPIDHGAALSPDGRYVLGAYHVPQNILTTSANLWEEAQEALGSLYVWERDKTGPPAPLKMPGRLLWFGFIDNTTAAILTDTDNRQLLFWDVAEGRQKSAVDLPSDWRPRSPDADIPPEHVVVPKNYGYGNALVAVSPGGRYMAVGSGKSVVMVSVAEARILGTLDVELPRNSRADYLGISFSANGEELVVALRLPEPRLLTATRFMICHAADGRRRAQWDVEGISYGPIFLETERGMLLQGGQSGEGTAHAWFQDATGSRHGSLEGVRYVGRWQKEGPALAVHLRPGEGELQLFALDRATFLDRLAVVQGVPSGEVAFDRASQKIVEVKTPGDWQPLPTSSGIGDIRGDLIVGAPRLTRLGDQVLGVFARFPLVRTEVERRKYYSITTVVRHLDRATGKPVGKPITLRSWDAPNDYNPDKPLPSEKLTVFGMSPDAELYVLSNPMAPSNLELTSRTGERLYEFAPLAGGGAVEWADFASNDILLAIGGGELAAWQVGPKSCQALYRMSGGRYTTPCQLSGDRRYLLASQEHSVAVLDVATGEGRNWLGVNAQGLRIADVSLSPDQKYAAAIYASTEITPDLVPLPKDGKIQPTAITVALWDLATGNAWQAIARSEKGAFVTWAGPEQLCLCSGETYVLDLRVKSAVLHYTDVSSPSETLGLAKSGDGRIWYRFGGRVWQDEFRPWSNVPVDDAKIFEPAWRCVTLTGEKTSDEARVLAADREIVSLNETPVRLELDLGDADAGQLQGARIVGELQRRGFRIGPDGCLLRIIPCLGSSSEQMRIGNRIETVPSIDYTWELVDRSGRVAWSDKTNGQPDLDNSKYRQWTGGGKYNFGHQSMKTALALEIMEDGAGLDVPKTLPKGWLFSGDTFVFYPQTLKWEFEAEIPPAE